jgi:hypothetical protein
MRICLIILFLAFVQTIYAGPTGPGAAWTSVRKITLSAATPLANFQVKLTLTAGQYTNMKSDGSDLRFYDINNNICSYWIEGAFNTSGTSTIWVKVPVSGSNALFMYYGNAAATAVSSGANTFDFFDDFTSASLTGWTTITSGGSVTQSGTNVTLSNSNGGTVSISNTSAFTPSSTSFQVEVKHREVGYNRNRFYTTTGSLGGSPIALGDYGYFSTAGTAQTTSKIFWNGTFLPATGTLLSNNTDYLTRWQITDGSTYNWFTFNYATGASLDATARNTTFGSNIRFISISVTEVASTSTIIDWARVRKASATFTDPTLTVGAQVVNLSASITAQTNVACNGQATGSATVTPTGGSAPFTYSWNTAPVQTTQTATGLIAGTYTVTVTDNIGLSALATATITQTTTITTSVASQSNPLCFQTTTGTIVIAGTGGTGSYSYSINNGASYQASNTFNVGAGVYKIRVKDSNGCESKSVQ